MSIGIPEVFLLFALLVYIYMVIDRICKCAEQCSLNKSLGNAYSNISPNWLNDLISKKIKTEET